MYRLILLSIILLQLNITNLFAQEKARIHLRTGAIELAPNVSNDANLMNAEKNYKLIFFKQAPNENTKSILKLSGVEFLEYVPDNGFIVKINAGVNQKTLSTHGVLGIYELPKELKLDYRLVDWNIPAHAAASENRVKVSVVTMNEENIQSYSEYLSARNLVAYQYGGDKRFGYFELNESEVNSLILEPWVRYIEIIDAPGKPESTEGRTVQKSNLINSDLSNGLSFNGSGVKLLVRDDGLVGPHIDYEGRLFNLTTDATGTHGDGVGGVMGGAGNIDPSIEGGSSGADIYVTNYVSSFQDTTLGLHIYDGVLITNSSYSNGCNAGYTTATRTVDEQVMDYPTLMHVFSAGNSNNNDCGYGAGNQWGNITGGHKMGKNVITVANLYNDASLVSSSSRGPAHDGRIKPDMAAHGQGQMSTDPNNQYQAFGGTSAAAPSLAGNLGQLIEAYRSLNNGSTPKSSLLKAAAMNSATDLGNAGPDFRYGYGLINTARAYDIIANNQYLFASLSQGNSNTHTVNVPAGTGQLRIMIYWHDPEGTIGTNKALVNDLDMVVNGNLLPLVLDHTPNATTLNNPAIPGVDHLNNMEQVVVDNPTTGNYSVQVSGFQVPSGPQEYVLVYSFIEDDIKVTYPIGGESLIPGNTEIVHWDAYGNTGSFTVEYSTNNGSTWNNIGTAPGDERNITWSVPSINTGDALIRVSRSSQSDISDENFNIFPVPQFNIQNNNATSLEVNWNNVTGANKYYIWRLGTKYMELIDSSTTSPYILGGLNGGDEVWLSVSANSSNIKGERALAQNFVFNPTGSCGGCISSSSNFPDYESFENGIGTFCQSNNDDIDFTVWNGGTVSNNTGPSSASQGNNYIYMEASLPNYPSKTSILGSQCYDLSNANSAQLKFDYHMYGSAMGTLEIEVSTDGGQTWSSPIWTKSGDQGNQWITDSIDFSSYQTSQVSYRFVGTTGTSWSSDIAIDNIEFDADISASQPQVIGEVGRASVNHINQTINFQNTYTNPIVVAGPPTINGGDPSVVQISNVTSNSFDVKIKEYEYLNQAHTIESFGYVVMEAGEFQLLDSTIIEANSITANSNNSTVNLASNYSSNPAIVASAISINDPNAVVIRINNVSSSQFQLKINEQESVVSHGNETVNYIAIEESVGLSGINFESKVSNIEFNHSRRQVPLSQPYSTSGAFLGNINSEFGSDPCALRILENWNAGGILGTFVEEEKSLNAERFHVKENIGYIMFYQTGNILGYPNNTNAEYANKGIDNSNILKTELNELNFQVYPNPNTGSFYVKLNESIINSEAEITRRTIEGKVLTKQKTQQSINEINVQTSPGIYILSVQNNGDIKHKKIRILE